LLFEKIKFKLIVKYIIYKYMLEISFNKTRFLKIKSNLGSYDMYVLLNTYTRTSINSIIKYIKNINVLFKICLN
jgi:hypothetical protein